MFTNDRLHLIVGVPGPATIDAQLINLVDDDRCRLEAALSAVLADQPVDDIEIRLADDVTCTQHICLLSLRALTDASGAVSGAIGLVTDVTERVQMRRELEVRASVDRLTSCLNRAAVLDVLDELVTRRSTCQHGVAVMYIDLDRFKPVNDSFGHAAGDRLLQAAADRLRLAVRDGDSIGRIGGDEFLVVCPQVASPAAAVELAQRSSSFLHDSVDVGPSTVDLRASVGVVWTCEQVDGDTLIAHADTAMYKSKIDRSDVTVHVLAPGAAAMDP